MIVKFKKMHGLGNDFIVINNLEHTILLTPDIIKKLADRHTGIGCDQVLVIEKSVETDIDFIYKIYNADGSESGQCGNGARCLAKFIREENLSQKNNLRLKTFSCCLELEHQPNNLIRVNMGIPEEIKKFSVSYQDQLFTGTALTLGNPHAVFVCDNIFQANINNLNLNHINIGFMQIISQHHIKLRVFERGAGETLACGSGACAAVAAGNHQNLLSSRVTVELALGMLEIDWPGINQPVWMTGPAENVFEGHIVL